MMKIVLYLLGGAIVGTVLGYASQCAGGSCPLLCVWWRGAIFGAVAGLAIYFAGVSGSTKPEVKGPERHSRGESMDDQGMR
jgi:hypothetical protein